MLKWKVSANRDTLGANSSVREEKKRSLYLQNTYFDSRVIPEKGKLNRMPRNLDLCKTKIETLEFEDGSSNSSPCRDEIANLDEVILSFRNKAFLNDEEVVIRRHNSNASLASILCTDSTMTQNNCKEPLKPFLQPSEDARKGYLADESDIISSNEGTDDLREQLYKGQTSPQLNSMPEIIQLNEKFDMQIWEEKCLDPTDDDDAEDEQELLYYMASSIDETSSTSGIGTGGSEWECKNNRNILHTLKAYCRKCKKEELAKKANIETSNNPNQTKYDNINDETPLKINSGLFCPHAFQKKLKKNSDDISNKISAKNNNSRLEEGLIKPYNSYRLSLPLEENINTNREPLEVVSTGIYIQGEAETSSHSDRRKELREINFNYGVKLNKFTFHSKSKKPKPKDEKNKQRKSHFFTNEFTSNDSISRSWLDDCIQREGSPPTTDCKAKLNKLFRSRSFSFSKIDLFLPFSSLETNKKEPQKVLKSPEAPGKKMARGLSRLAIPKGISKSLPKPRVMQSRPCVLDFFKPKLKTEDTETEKHVPSFPLQDMSAIQMAGEGRDYLMWCPNGEFDRTVATLDIRGLVELIHTLQDAMAVEQQTFDSLSQQQETIEDPLLQQRMSAALCTSQTRLARLCARNMRCFTQQALKSRQREQGANSVLDSRSSSPRDSGFAVSSSGSEFENDTRGWSSQSHSSGLSGGHTFKNSLAFFQRAASIVSNTSRSSNGGHRSRDSKRSSKRANEVSPCSSVTINTSCAEALGSPSSPSETLRAFLAGRRNSDTDNETYEQVLYINGRPQFQDDSSKRSRSFDPLLESRISTPAQCEQTSVAVNTEPTSWGRSSSPTGDQRSRRPRIEVSSADSPRHLAHSAEPSVDAEPLYHSVSLSNPAHSRSLGDVSTCVTLPRRKPVLNFGSVSGELRDEINVQPSNVNGFQDLDPRDKLPNDPSNSSTITRAHSFKEILDLTSEPPQALTRTKSLYDGLNTNFGEGISASKLLRAPSVDEILESVKFLRTKKNSMVKSSPDLILQMSQEKGHSSRVKVNGKSSHNSSKTSAATLSPAPPLTVASRLADLKRLENGRKNYDLGRSNNPGEHCYENIGISPGCQYENVPSARRAELIYDSPRGNKAVLMETPPISVARLHGDSSSTMLDYYENVDFDPLYENIVEKEPTYMDVFCRPGKETHSTDREQIVYTKMEEAERITELESRKSKQSTVSTTHTNYDQTYDVPKVATHIYDTPVKQARKVRSRHTSKAKLDGDHTYDTPFNNRSVLPQSSKILLQAKNEQIRKIEDIFADCEKDSLDGDIDDADSSPDIPPPDYYRCEEDESNDNDRKKSDSSSTQDYIDEGIGESDSKSYFVDEQGLEVIFEEPENEYSSSHSSAEDLRRRFESRLRCKGKRRSLGSLEGSEGIGSAEGEEGDSSGCSEGSVEEDCASSGIHSEDTSSPGPLLEDKRRKESFQVDKSSPRKDEDLTQKDRSIEVYPETLRQRQRNMAPSPSKVDIKNWDPSCPSSISADEGKKFLPSVKALRSQFENVKSPGNLRKSSNSSTNSLVLSSLDTSSCFGSMTSSQFTFELASPATPSSKDSNSVDEAIEPIFRQFKDVDEELKEMMGKPPSTQGWNPHSLLKRIYYVPDAPKIQRREAPFVDIEGYLEKLPSGRKKATFWNAWKRRYFVAKDGMLYYYQNNQTEKPSMTLSLMGGKIEIMDANMVSLDDGGRESRNAGMLCIDDGKGHCVVVRCPSRQEAERWKEALETHTIDDYSTHYVQPWPHPTNPTLLRDTLVVDIGSCSVRAGVLASQPTLPQLFFPSVVATHRETNTQTWGIEALMPDVRSVSSVSFPIRPSHKISKFSVDLNAVSSLLQKTFSDLKVDPKDYNIQLSVPRVLNLHTQAELLKILFEKFGVKSVNMTHQAILALYAYNATSGVVVDIGERLDVVPVIDGYIVDGGVSRVPYGGYRIMDHLRQFLFQKNISLITEVDSYIIRQVLETICYCAQHYNTEKQRCTLNSEKFEKFALLTEFFPESDQYEIFRNITLDFGRFQTTEGLFNPEAWGLDHPGLHKLVHKAIQECSMDIRKEMSRSVFLSGGVTQLPGIVERLTIELDNLTPPAIRPKVHASPHRYHAAYLGACELAESLAFSQSKITKEEWIKQGNSALRKWAL